jgi:hypothetical protein
MVERRIPFPVQTAPGGKQQEAGGRIINGYIEQLGANAPNKTAIRRMPGLINFGTTTRTGYRGSLLSQGVLYSAFSTKLESHTSAGGASTLVGTLNGTKRGFFSANGNATPDKFFTDPDGNIATFTPRHGDERLSGPGFADAELAGLPRRLHGVHDRRWPVLRH